MAIARIEYIGGLSHSARGMTFLRGEARMITNPDDILFFSNAGGFLVSDVPELQPVKAKAAAAALAPPPVVESDGDEEDMDAAADIDGEDDEEVPPPPPVPVAKQPAKAAPKPTPKKPK
jgi:hypothetical protein